MLSKTICAKNLRKLIETDKTDTDREGLMKAKLCKSTSSFPLVETIKLEVIYNVVHTYDM